MAADPPDVETQFSGRRIAWVAIPSWVLSLVLHAVFLGLLAVTMHGNQVLGTARDPDRIVGIYSKLSHDAIADAVETESPGPEAEPAAPAASQSVPQPEPQTTPEQDDASPRKLLDLPADMPQRVGPGPALPAPQTLAAEVGVKPVFAGKPDAAPAGGGGGGVPFFDADATGKRFVYVLDSSGSMYGHNAIGVAKAELLASLQKLERTQEFLIIFYNDHSYPMVRLGWNRGLFPATDENRNQARQFIRSIQPDGGTNHVDALLRALEVKPTPDVIFFLSDADTGLSAADLDRIKKKNAGKTQIHAVEFGQGANLAKVRSFLKKLADQNKGTYSYRDVTQFDGKVGH